MDDHDTGSTTRDPEAQAIDDALAEHDRKRAEARGRRTAASLFALAALGVSVPMPRRAPRGPHAPPVADEAALAAARAKRARKAAKAALDEARARGGR